MWWRKKQLAKVVQDFLLRFGSEVLRWDDLQGGIVGIGPTGSGKTSSFALLMEAMLASRDISMVVNCVKPDEASRVLRVCERAGCLEDVCLVKPGSGFSLDILQTELNRPGGSSQSATQLLSTLNEVALRSNSQGQGEESFWAGWFNDTLFNAIELVSLSGGGSIPSVNKVIMTAPQNAEQAASPEWANRSFCGQLLKKAAAIVTTPAQERRLQRVLDHFLEAWVSIGEKARGAALAQVGSVLSKFTVEPFYDILCSGVTTLSPESLFTDARRKIVIIDMAVLLYGEAARFLQIALSMMFEAAALRRNVEHFPREVVIWRDEAQCLCHPAWSSTVLSLGRSQKCTSVSLFQTLPGLISAFGGSHKNELEAKNFITNHTVKFAFASGCKDSIEYMSELIGRERKLFYGGGNAPQQEEDFSDLLGVNGHAQMHWNEQLDYAFPPSQFMRLRTGGAKNHQQVDAIWFQQGRMFDNNNFKKVTFKQGEW